VDDLCRDREGVLLVADVAKNPLTEPAP
jgi:hypothetical protein